MRVGEEGGGDGTRRDEHPFSYAAAEHVEGHERVPATIDLHLQERAVGKPLDALGRPHVADHRCLEHQRSSRSTWTPRDLALSRANGVRTALGPTTSRAPSAAAFFTVRSVTAPRSTRTTGVVAVWVAPGWAGPSV